MSQLSTKTHYLVTRLGDFPITAEQAKKVATVLETQPRGVIDLDNNMVAVHAIDGVLTGEQYAILNKRRIGGYQCKYGYWHNKGQQCAHMWAKEIKKNK